MEEVHRQVGHRSRPGSARSAGRSATNCAEVGRLDAFAVGAEPCSSGQFSGGTARTIRSWASEIQISVYESPSYFSGARLELDLGAESRPISPTAELKPPAPQSVIERNSPRSRAWRTTSRTIFSVIALPICTAPPGEGFALAGQLGRAERGAVDAVAAGPAADGDDPVAGLDVLLRHAPGDHADGAAEDQRIGQVTRDRPPGRR